MHAESRNRSILTMNSDEKQGMIIHVNLKNRDIEIKFEMYSNFSSNY